MNPAYVLEAAADLIERVGWWDGTPGRANRAHCARTAIVNVDPKGCRTATYDALIAFVGGNPLDSTKGDQIAEWNDAQLDGDIVIRTLRKCAAEWRAEHEGAIS